jgi:hypothetical protein
MQILRVNKTLGTVFTRERILLGVLTDLVVLEMLLAVEALAAIATRVERVIDVLGLVLFEFVLAGERHQAVVAPEGPDVAVTGESVAFEVKRGLERLAALVTRLVLERLVLANVLGQVGTGLVGCAAKLTSEELEIARVVRGQMVVERVAAVELLAACSTRVVDWRQRGVRLI